MTIQPTSNRAAMVDKDNHWLPIRDNPPPSGPKMLLINRRYGVAVIGPYRPDQFWTHWCPLPTFSD